MELNKAEQFRVYHNMFEKVVAEKNRTESYNKRRLFQMEPLCEGRLVALLRPDIVVPDSDSLTAD
jgi:hypothetical protein